MEQDDGTRIYVKGEDTVLGVRYSPSDEVMNAALNAKNNLDDEVENRYECEVCGTVDMLTEEQAYIAGWDYPPFIGVWGIVSPRTCPNCTIEKTAYWAVLTRQELSEKHMATINRIMSEPVVVNE